MGFNRIEAKFNAKISMRQTRPSPIWITALFLLLTVIVKQVVVAVVGDPFVEMVQYLQMNYDPYEVLNYVFLRNSAHTALYCVVSLVLGLYGIIMNYGYISYALRLSRNEQPDHRNLFDGFARVGRVLWAAILQSIFLAFWELLAMLPSFAVLILVGLFAESEAVYFLIMLWYVLFLAALIVALAISYRYRMSSYFLIDRPDCTALEAIRASKMAMRGWKMELFTLDLSFFGWYLLTGLTFGIMGVWVLPYQSVTEANFYDCITAERQDTAEERPADPYGSDYRSL